MFFLIVYKTCDSEQTWKREKREEKEEAEGREKKEGTGEEEEDEMFDQPFFFLLSLSFLLRETALLPSFLPSFSPIPLKKGV